MNGDGKPDLVTANPTSGAVNILLNNGMGGFAAASQVLGTTAPRYVAVADMNLDKKPDLIVSDSTAGKIIVFLGDGLGGFGGSRSYVGVSGQLLTGDFDGDLIPDVVTLNGSRLTVLFSNGSGSFASRLNLDLTNTPRTLRAADLDGDTRLDLILGGDRLLLMIGDGAGNFNSPDENLLLDSPAALAVGDFNGDHFPDLLFGAAAPGGRLSLLINYSPPP